MTRPNPNGRQNPPDELDEPPDDNESEPWNVEELVEAKREREDHRRLWSSVT